MPAQAFGEICADRLAQLSAVVLAAGTGAGQAGQRQIVLLIAQFGPPEVEGFGGVRGLGALLDVVRVRGGGRELEGLAEDVGAVHAKDVVEQDREGVPVVDQVVLDVDEPVVALGQAHERPADQRCLERVERCLGLGAQEVREGRLGVRLRAEVGRAQPRRTRSGDALRRYGTGGGDEFEPQAGVAGEGGFETQAQRVGVERAPQVQ